MRRYVLAMLAMCGSAQAQTPDQMYVMPEEEMACDTLPVEQRDYAGITFTVRSTETSFVQYGNGNWVDQKKTTFFNGEVKLAYAYAPTCAGINPDHLVPDDPVVTIPPGLETELMMEEAEKCSVAGAMLQCIADATDKAAEMVEACRTSPAGKMPAYCGGSAAAAPQSPSQGSSVEADDGGAEGGSNGPQDGIGLVRDPGQSGPMDMKEFLASLPPEVRAQMPEDFEIDDIDLDMVSTQASIFKALSCIGSTDVRGSGTGYDGTHLRQPHYSFGISGSWVAEANYPGTSQGCSAAAIINFPNGEAQLFLEPGPGRITTAKSYNNYMGVVEQPEEAFPGVKDGMVEVNLKFTENDDEDLRDLNGTIELPDVRPDENTLVQTTVTYAFSMAY